MITGYKQSNDSTDFRRCAVYARYSTKMQRPASLEDQLRTCQEFADQKAWPILDEHIYQDAALSGQYKVKREGILRLEEAAEKRPRPFDCVLFDDTSRLGRDQAEVLSFAKLMKHHGVSLYFVSQNLDSNQDGFAVQLNVHSMVDEMNISRMRKKVVSGQKGRVLAKFHVGSIPYGYDRQEVASTDPSAIGRAATVGTILVVNEEQAKTVIRIFTLFRDGYSFHRIAVILNEELVPSPTNARRRSVKSGWSPSAIKTILRNEKYRGLNVWNVSKQSTHPTTGRVEKVYKPKNEQIVVPIERLRIVTDELWNAAAERLIQYEDRQKVRVEGGYNRAKGQPYLYSGLLYCALCGSKMVIGGKQGRGVYRCSNHRLRRGCPNSLTVRADRAEKQITAMLSKQLFLPEYIDPLIEEVYRDVYVIWEKQRDAASMETLPVLEKSRQECKTKISHIIDAIERAGTPDLSDRLQARQRELEHIEHKLQIAKGKKKLQISKDELRVLVHQRVDNLLEVLKGDVPLARKFLQEHMPKITLFPDRTTTEPAEPGTEHEPAFAAIGKIDLFKLEEVQRKGVLQGCEGTLTSLQHTKYLYEFIFIMKTQDAENCHLVGPFCELLGAHPELSAQPRAPKDWAKLLQGFVPDNGNPNQKLGYGTVGRCFNKHWDLLAERLHITVSRNPDSYGYLYQLSVREQDVVSESSQASSTSQVDRSAWTSAADDQAATSASTSSGVDEQHPDLSDNDPGATAARERRWDSGIPHLSIPALVARAEALARESGGVLPRRKIHAAGAHMVEAIARCPEAFAHIPQERLRAPSKSTQEWLVVAEELAAQNGGLLPRTKDLPSGLKSAVSKSREAFAHLLPKGSRVPNRSIPEWVAYAEELAEENGGFLMAPSKVPSSLRFAMKRKPEAFEHIPQMTINKRRVPKKNSVPSSTSVVERGVGTAIESASCNPKHEQAEGFGPETAVAEQGLQALGALVEVPAAEVSIVPELQSGPDGSIHLPFEFREVLRFDDPA